MSHKQPWRLISRWMAVGMALCGQRQQSDIPARQCTVCGHPLQANDREFVQAGCGLLWGWAWHHFGSIGSGLKVPRGQWPVPCLLSYEEFGAQEGSRGAIARAWGAVPGQSWGHTGPMWGPAMANAGRGPIQTVSHSCSLDRVRVLLPAASEACTVLHCSGEVKGKRLFLVSHLS